MNKKVKLYFGSYNHDHRLVLLKNPRRQCPYRKVWEFDHTDPNYAPQLYGFLDTSLFVGNFDEGYNTPYDPKVLADLQSKGILTNYIGVACDPSAWMVNSEGVIIGWDQFFTSPDGVYKHLRAMMRYTVEKGDDQNKAWDWIFNNISIKLIELDLPSLANSAPSATWDDATPKNITKIKVY